MENEVPYEGIVVTACVVLGIASALLARRAIVAFLLGLLVSAAFVGYCQYYRGPLEGLGIAHSFAGALPLVALFYLSRWLRGGFHRTKTPTRTNMVD